MFKKVVSVVCLIIVSQITFSQEKESKDFDKSLFGFTLGTHVNNLKLSRQEGGSIIESDPSLGIRLGIFYDKANPRRKRLHLAPRVEIAYYNNELVQTDLLDNKTYMEVGFVALEGKPQFYYELGKWKNKPYIIFGSSYSLVIDDIEGSTLFPTKSFFSIDAGIGCNKKFAHFMMSPELRYSRGGTAINSNSYLGNNFKQHSISLLFNFKG